MGGELDQWKVDQDLNNYSYDPPSQGYEIQPKYAEVGYRDNQVAGSYERSWRSHDRDRQTGSYTSAKTKEVASRGETFKERSTGRVGYKDEHKTTSTLRLGDPTGYTEYQYQERYRRVDFGGDSGGRSGGKGSGGGRYSTSKKYLK